MDYDMHVHYESPEEIIEIVHLAETLNLRLLGLVTHSRNSLKKIMDLTSDVEILWGIEVKYPFLSRPKGYEYVIIHLENVLVTSELVKKIRGDIIAHPTSYNVSWTEDALEEVKSRELLIEFNSSHYRPHDDTFYNKLVELGIKIVYGSDAHQPEDILAYPHPNFAISAREVLEILAARSKD